MSGNGNVAPVPTSEPAAGLADAVCALPAKTTKTATAITASPSTSQRFMVSEPLSPLLLPATKTPQVSFASLRLMCSAGVNIL